jgi:hypothetical protein
MQRRLLVLVFGGVAALAFLGCSKNRVTAPPSEELKPLTVDEVATRIAAGDGKTFVYDDNSEDSWKAGHVPGAKWLDDEKVTAEALPPDKAATLIFYCHNEA